MIKLPLPSKLVESRRSTATIFAIMGYLIALIIGSMFATSAYAKWPPSTNLPKDTLYVPLCYKRAGRISSELAQTVNSDFNDENSAVSQMYVDFPFPFDGAVTSQMDRTLCPSRQKCMDITS